MHKSSPRRGAGIHSRRHLFWCGSDGAGGGGYVAGLSVGVPDAHPFGGGAGAGGAGAADRAVPAAGGAAGTSRRLDCHGGGALRPWTVDAGQVVDVKLSRFTQV